MELHHPSHVRWNSGSTSRRDYSKEICDCPLGKSIARPTQRQCSKSHPESGCFLPRKTALTLAQPRSSKNRWLLNKELGSLSNYRPIVNSEKVHDRDLIAADPAFEKDQLAPQLFRPVRERPGVITNQSFRS